jgi:nucleotide-binding universal stress UspA family protein
MKHPLVPIDGSPASLRAFDHALAELAGRPGAELLLLNVQAPLIQPWPGKLVSPDMVEAEQQAEGRRLLQPVRERARDAGVAVRTEVLVGSAAECIVALAGRAGCDAIVMGTRGMGTVAGLLMGSVAQKVLHLGTLPLTLVK